jgi:hypothetical protein
MAMDRMGMQAFADPTVPIVRQHQGLAPGGTPIAAQSDRGLFWSGFLGRRRLNWLG